MTKSLLSLAFSFLVLVSAQAVNPALTSPIEGTTLPGSTAEFRWTPNDTPVFEWFLTVGKTKGSFDYFAQKITNPAARSQIVTTLPSNGSVVWVRLLWTTSSQWFSLDYQFSAALPNPPSLTSPSPGSALTSTTATFAWADNGTPVEGWAISGGLNPGGSELFSSGNLGASIKTFTANNIPQNGQVFWVRLAYLLDGVWRNLDYQFRQNSLSLTPGIVEPTPGLPLSSHNFTLKWTPATAVVGEWTIFIGRNLGEKDLLDSGSLPASTLSLAVSTIPNTVTTFWIRLFHRPTGGTWTSVDYQYVVNPAADPNPIITSPVPGTTITTSSVRFSWTPKNNLVTEFWLYVGTTSGGREILDSGSLGTATSLEVTNLPSNGAPIYATLNYRIDGVWRQRIHTYTNARLPRMVSPATGTTLAGPNQRFVWDANGVTANAWSITLGTAAGANNIYDSGTLLSSIREVPNARITSNGQDVFARLWWLTGFNWNFVDFTFKTSVPSDPVLKTPAPGPVVIGANQELTFTWDRNGATLFGWWLYVGATVGGRDYHNSGLLETSVLSRTVTGLPRQAPQIFVRLWWLAGVNQWKFADYTYSFTSS